MNSIEGIQWITPTGTLGPTQRNAAGGTGSGTLDLRGFNRARVVFCRFKNSTAAAGPGMKMYIRHASSTKTWASGTALGTVVSAVAVTSANTQVRYAYDIDMAGIGPYLTCKVSAITQSGCVGVICEGSRGSAVPAVNLANVATSGFTSLTAIPAQPA